MTEQEFWAKWESQTVNGVFPLRRFVGRSDHSVVFLTEYKGRNAALKLLPADPATADAQVLHWQRIAALTHPNLMRILETGRCELGGHPFLFLVMDYAEQTLAQILAHRPLTPDEAREVLAPSLAALSFLNGRNLVQGQIKPTNLLVVDDELKLATDTIRDNGAERPPGAKPSVYDAPETRIGAIEIASDVWSLGVTLIEALTQKPPKGTEQSSEIWLPPATPPEFADTLRRCLSRNPTLRPSIAELRSQFAQLPGTAVAPSPSPRAPMSRWPAPTAIGIVVLLIVALAIRLLGHRNGEPSAATSAQPVSPPVAAQALGAPNPPAAGNAIAAPSPAVVHEEIPLVSRSARDSIRGEIKVVVLVNVDRAGNVVAETVATRGPSRYFARLAADAAKRWRFAPADAAGIRKWMLQFEFTRAGATAKAALI